jgi:hypothetical protein
LEGENVSCFQFYFPVEISDLGEFEVEKGLDRIFAKARKPGFWRVNQTLQQRPTQAKTGLEVP